MSNSLIWPIIRILSGGKSPSQIFFDSEDNEEVLPIHQNSSITGT